MVIILKHIVVYIMRKLRGPLEIHDVLLDLSIANIIASIKQMGLPKGVPVVKDSLVQRLEAPPHEIRMLASGLI